MTRTRRALAGVVIVAVFACAACSKERVVAKVGNYTIRAKDVSMRTEVVRVLSPGETRDYGFEQMVRLYTYAQILANMGRPVTDEILKEEEKRIDRETLNPEMLGKIKDRFSRDHDAYVHVFVLPTYVESQISEIFNHEPVVQQQVRHVAETFLAEARKNPKLFSTLARKQKREVSRFSVSPSQGIQWQTPPGTPRDLASLHRRQMAVVPGMRELLRAQGEKLIDDLTSGASRGGISDQVVDAGNIFLVLRYVERGNNGSYIFDAVKFPKLTLEQWIDKEKQHINIALGP